MTYQQAQTNCQQKFGHGRLVEPLSIEIGKALVAKAKALNVIAGSSSHAVWIGYDQIGHGTGNFKYASTGLKSPLESLSNANWFDFKYDEDCMTFSGLSLRKNFLDDVMCTKTYTSICEGF